MLPIICFLSCHSVVTVYHRNLFLYCESDPRALFTSYHSLFFLNSIITTEKAFNRYTTGNRAVLFYFDVCMWLLAWGQLEREKNSPPEQTNIHITEIDVSQSSMAQSTQISRLYLLIYNTACAILWARILLTTISTLITSDISTVYTNLEPWTRYAQTIAVAEILHAATGKINLPSYI